MIASYATYALVLQRQLTVSTVFSSGIVFELLRFDLRRVINSLPGFVQGKVSLDRVDHFLKQTDLLDEYKARKSNDVRLDAADRIGMRDCSFSWSHTEGENSHKLIVNQEVSFVKDAIHLICGPTGSGKTALLLSLLGEMHRVEEGPEAWFSFPRSSGIAYAPQEPWILSQSIKENILFGEAYNGPRYNQVLHQCALEPDLALLEDGDESEVGERGLTLSGGQKARIALARAIYSPAATILLDDILSALDAQTSRWIVDTCFKGPLLKGRTVLIVSHNVALIEPVCSSVTTVDANGTVHQSRNPSTPRDAIPLTGAEPHGIQNSKDRAVPSHAKRLVAAEHVDLGHVEWPAFKLYIASMSRASFLFWFAVLSMGLCYDGLTAAQSWILGYWSSENQSHPDSNDAATWYLLIYCLLAVGATIAFSLNLMLLIFGSLRASRVIHESFMNAVLGTTLRWLDTTPTARVLIRATQDIYTLDQTFSQGLRFFLAYSVSMFVKFCAVVLFAPAFVFPGLLISFIALYIGHLYMMAQLPIKREMSNSRAPVIEHFQTTIHGLTSIRAYGVQDAFLHESMRRIDRYTRSARTFLNLNRWISIRSEVLGGIFTAGLGAYLVYWTQNTPADVGFSLAMAVGFSSLILGWVRLLNNLELSGNR
ncbi:hypothetical protein HGRIS_005644 [Hohenbuehelia grisea]|uniref:Uncharacterized protein n=1 Tax=Hohenbuehelia grisea TaxID=104357 RepID=A0ABR3JXR4_9AGAR